MFRTELGRPYQDEVCFGDRLPSGRNSDGSVSRPDSWFYRRALPIPMCVSKTNGDERARRCGSEEGDEDVWESVIMIISLA